MYLIFIVYEVSSDRWPNSLLHCNTLGNLHSTDRKYQTSGFEYFVKSEFEKEPLMLDKQIIPHFKPLDVGSKKSQEQPYSSIRDDNATFLVKIHFLKKWLHDSP